jgi:FkbM family methyltransferase
VARHYPFRFISPFFNAHVGRMFFDSPERLWVISQPYGGTPLMELNVSNRLQRRIYYFPKAWGKWYAERPLARLLARELTPGSVFVDIGANLGFFSFLAAELVGPQGGVWSFEPEPDTFDCLERSARLYGLRQLRCFNLALADEDRDMIFHRDWYDGSSSLVPEKPGQPSRYRDSIRVCVRTLDTLVKEHALEVQKIRLIKIDVEGAEARTISGMIETLVQASYPDLWIEVRGPRGSDRAPDTFCEVDRQLGQLGYKAYRWAEGRNRPVTTRDVLGREDILFRRDSRDGFRPLPTVRAQLDEGEELDSQ